MLNDQIYAFGYYHNIKFVWRTPTNMSVMILLLYDSYIYVNLASDSSSWLFYHIVYSDDEMICIHNLEMCAIILYQKKKLVYPS